MTDHTDAQPAVLRETPLAERHRALGAAFTDFGGWSMPVRYTSDLAEHHAVRTAAGIFDISHMAEFVVTRSAAAAFLDYALAGRVSTMKVGKAKYSLVLTASGGIVDDVIVYRVADDRFLVIANAGNRDAVATAFEERVADFVETRPPMAPVPGAVDFAVVAGANKDVHVEDVTDAFALIAVQGPAARGIVEATAAIGAPQPSLDELGYYAWSTAAFQDADGEQTLFIARTGYTGEDGFELLVPTASAGALWDALLEAGRPLGLVPAGLAARDTLRLEAGMPLYGHELSLDILPAQAGLGRVVAADKEEFVGKAGLSAIVATDAPVLVGLVADGKRAGRAGYAVYDAELRVGEITSGALSPTLGHPVAMAFVSPSSSAPGTELSIDVRGTRIPATVTALPFYRRNP